MRCVIKWHSALRQNNIYLIAVNSVQTLSSSSSGSGQSKMFLCFQYTDHFMPMHREKVGTLTSMPKWEGEGHSSGRWKGCHTIGWIPSFRTFLSQFWLKPAGWYHSIVLHPSNINMAPFPWNIEIWGQNCWFSYFAYGSAIFILSTTCCLKM